MKLSERAWKIVGYFFGITSLSPENGVLHQEPFLQEASHTGNGLSVVSNSQPPVFHPPGAPPPGDPGSRFECDYTAMGANWTSCSTREDRSCWLKNTVTGERFDINTNYEIKAPIGKTRYFWLNITDGIVNGDGIYFPQAKLFNNTYPGPWLQACWGDTIVVNVTNHLKHNGTSIHWHGIRQLRTMEMDGVNGITQCAIAPGDSFVYKWKAVQYGSSWYHSHYSLQYADGAAGPLTLHGPSSAPFDEPHEPLIMTDWAHNSAFRAIYAGNLYPSILLNGRGNVTQFNNGLQVACVPEPHTFYFEDEKTAGLGRPKRYLLRLINTSFDSTFIFSIDHHNLTMIGADFVPIQNYSNSSVLVGIGQRYHVIVEANPVPNDQGEQPPKDGNFWVRTWVAKDCGTQGDPGYEKTGILRYDWSSTARPTSHKWHNVAKLCSDETYSSLVPVLKWNVSLPANRENKWGQGFNLTGHKKGLVYPLSVFSLGESPLRIDYGNPIFRHLHEPVKEFDKSWVVIPEDYKDDDWVWLIIDSSFNASGYGAHPIHLHGHDFALLAQEENKNFTGDISHFVTDNPPRRDVVLLPNGGKGGYVAIAFKTDNPGSWLVHCHIARHASEGLAMQILERQSDADKLWPPGDDTQEEAERVCKNWRDWQERCNNWSDKCIWPFQDDSGI